VLIEVRSSIIDGVVQSLLDRVNAHIAYENFDFTELHPDPDEGLVSDQRAEEVPTDT
jgi:hypothetical protein